MKRTLKIKAFVKFVVPAYFITLLALSFSNPANAVVTGDMPVGETGEALQETSLSLNICPTCDWQDPKIDNYTPDIAKKLEEQEGKNTANTFIFPHLLEFDAPKETGGSAFDKAIAGFPLEISNIAGSAVFYPVTTSAGLNLPDVSFHPRSSGLFGQTGRPLGVFSPEGFAFNKPKLSEQLGQQPQINVVHGGDRIDFAGEKPSIHHFFAFDGKPVTVSEADCPGIVAQGYGDKNPFVGLETSVFKAYIAGSPESPEFYIKISRKVAEQMQGWDLDMFDGFQPSGKDDYYIFRIPEGELICYRMKQGDSDPHVPNDPYFYPKEKKKKSKSFFGGFGLSIGPISTGSGGSDDSAPAKSQWALSTVGFKPLGGKEGRSAWDIETGQDNPVIIAVIDSGLDFLHPDFSLDNLYINTKEIPGNFIDDDGNGYVDDIAGWNFVDWNNAPFDDDGHGTVVSGIIAATSNNSEGIAGINWGAKIMPLKVSDSSGVSTAFNSAKAVIYAADNGAKVINLSIGGRKISKIEQMAIDYAYSKGCLIIAAAGNEGIDIKDYAPASLRGVITVGGTDQEDNPVENYNFGENVFISAPAKNIFSLRARNTSTLGRQLLNMHSFGPDRLYYIASGTSFAAPIVSATATLLFAHNPSLTNVQAEWILRKSSVDVGKKGWDPYAGYGRLDALKALSSEIENFIYARLFRLKKKGNLLEIYGTAAASSFGQYSLEIGEGAEPDNWRKINESSAQAGNSKIGSVKLDEIKGASEWTVRLSVKDKNGKEDVATKTFKVKDYL